MKKSHELSIPRDSYEAVVSGVKTFLVQRDSINYTVGDFLLLKESVNSGVTGEESMHQITYITDYLEPEGFIIMSIRKVPKSFRLYLDMTSKEQSIFKSALTHLYLFSSPDRETSNTLWDIIFELIEHQDLSDADRNWYREYWSEED